MDNILIPIPIDLKSLNPKSWLIIQFQQNWSPGFPGDQSIFIRDDLDNNIYTEGLGDYFYESILELKLLALS